MYEIDKFKFKKFVADAIHMSRGAAARLAEDYTKTEYWISDILNPTSETDGFLYPAIMFMKRLASHSPQAHAMIDDEWRRINDELRSAKAVGVNESLDNLMSQVNRAHFDLITAYRNRQGMSELKSQAALLSTHTNCLIQGLEPQGTELPADKKLKVAKR